MNCTRQVQTSPKEQREYNVEWKVCTVGTFTLLLAFWNTLLRKGKAKMDSPTVAAVLPYALLALVALSSASVSRCPDGQFLTRDTHTCRVCDTCPQNQIIRKPCSRDSNTLCGPFSEFNEFHQAPRPRLEVEDLPVPDTGGGEVAGDDSDGEADSEGSRKRLYDYIFDSLDPKPKSNQKHTSHHKHHLKKDKSGKEHHRHSLGEKPFRTDKDQHHHHDRNGDLPPGVNGAAAREASQDWNPQQRTSAPRQREDVAPSLQNPDDGESQWKVLALALIVVLCVVCVFLIVFVFVVCYMRSSRAHMKKVLYSADNGPTSRNHNRNATTSLHYVPVLTHAQNRAGSSCEGATSAPPCGMVDSSYLYSDEYDADNSGQTISTAKSSDYVYFKSPHNGNVYDV